MRHVAHARFWSRSRSARVRLRGIAALVIAGIVVVAGSSPPRAVVARPDGPTTDLVLTGRIRDFPTGHPDFCINPSGGSNWVEGLVGAQTDAQGRPVYAGPGRRVIVPASDAAGHPIATALVEQTISTPVHGLRLVQPLAINNNPTLDTYNPAAGPYGGPNVGPAPQVLTGQTMPVVTVPEMETYVGEFLRAGNASSALDGSFRCSKFIISNQHRLTVAGDVTVVVDEQFVVENNTDVVLAPGATLTVYAKKDAVFQNDCRVNMDPPDHTRFVFYRLGSGDLVLKNSVDVCGTFVCPNGRLELGNNCNVYGSVEGRAAQMQNSSGLHIAETQLAGCSMLGDREAQLGAPDTGNVSSASSFADWFRDAPGVNQSAQARLLFRQDEAGAYAFSSADFRPIDGKLLAAGEPGPNRNFTYELDGEFTYAPCSGQFFQFSGDGDALVYVDGRLVMELAGHGTNVTQYVDLERLGLSAGEPHRLQFFHASRSCGGTRFEVRTNIELRTTYVVELGTIPVWD